MPRPFVIPGAPDGLMAIINRRRSEFAGFRMELEQEPAEPADPPAEPEQESPEDKPLGPPGEKALKAVRDENKKLRDDLNGFMQSMADALGVNPSEKKGDALAEIQQQVATLTRQNKVQAVARAHSITDESDIELLMAQPDEAAIAKLAARLKPTAEEPGANGATPPRTPKPDPSVGKGNHGGNRPSSVAQAAEEYRQRTKKTNA